MNICNRIWLHRDKLCTAAFVLHVAERDYPSCSLELALGGFVLRVCLPQVLRPDAFPRSWGLAVFGRNQLDVYWDGRQWSRQLPWEGTHLYKFAGMKAFAGVDFEILVRALIKSQPNQSPEDLRRLVEPVLDGFAHQLRYESECVPAALRHDSRDWLIDRGMGRLGGHPWPHNGLLPALGNSGSKP
ncbi:hypothetical protein [Hydrogenophaga sp.]|uniref:hypothetical protein n=1 Tax=Hydrogenophaga sp. TaxID=1904254 RepID=UPI0025C2C392|nr:hypothetical protein [Hydrogenophaga sp.]MBT9467110.1 hypothetical protein [Hydrogenophaga sp.]